MNIANLRTANEAFDLDRRDAGPAIRSVGKIVKVMRGTTADIAKGFEVLPPACLRARSLGPYAQSVAIVSSRLIQKPISDASLLFRGRIMDYKILRDRSATIRWLKSRNHRDSAFVKSVDRAGKC